MVAGNFRWITVLFPWFATPISLLIFNAFLILGPIIYVRKRIPKDINISKNLLVPLFVSQAIFLLIMILVCGILTDYGFPLNKSEIPLLSTLLIMIGFNSSCNIGRPLAGLFGPFFIVYWILLFTVLIRAFSSKTRNIDFVQNSNN